MGSTYGMAEFKPFVQAFLYVLIDGVQYPGDENDWVYYTLYENRTFVGLTTVYQFNLSWSHQRHRLS
jgi:histone acetyltransferase 1